MNHHDGGNLDDHRGIPPSLPSLQTGEGGFGNSDSETRHWIRKPALDSETRWIRKFTGIRKLRVRPDSETHLDSETDLWIRKLHQATRFGNSAGFGNCPSAWIWKPCCVGNWMMGPFTLYMGSSVSDKHSQATQETRVTHATQATQAFQDTQVTQATQATEATQATQTTQAS